MKISWSYIALILLGLIQFPMAQVPYFQEHKPGDNFRNLYLEKIYQDREQMIWFAGSEGLIQYNGLKYELITTRDSFTTSEVTAVFEDRSGRFWVGMKSGEIAIKKFNELTKWLPEEGIPKKKITDIVEDRRGQIWFATYGEGIYCWDGMRLYNFDEQDGLLGKDIYDLEAGYGDVIWAGTDGGLNGVSFIDGKKEIVSVTRADGLPDEIIKSIDMSVDSVIWIGMHDLGIIAYDPDSGSLTNKLNIPGLRTINCIEVTSHDQIWIGTDDQGLWRYDLRAQTYQNVSRESDLNEVQIFDLLQDVEGNIWIGADHMRVFSGNLQFEQLDLDIHSIQAVLHDSQDRMWIGNPTNLQLFVRVSGSYEKQDFSFSDRAINVLSLHEDEYGRIWVGSFGQGLYLFSPGGIYQGKYDEEDGLTNGSILSIASNSQKVWLATLGGVTEFDLPENDDDIPVIGFRNFDSSSGLSSNYIYKVIVDKNGTPWFATDGRGVGRKENGRIQNFDSVAGHPLKIVYSITEDAHGDIWCSSAGNGVYKLTNGQKHIGTDEGLSNFDVRSIIADQKGNLLIIHPYGIDLFQPERTHFIYYDDEIGIDNIEPNLNAVCEDNLGNIWLGTNTGIIKYNLFEDTLSIHPRTHITQINIFQKPLELRDDLVLEYNENYVSFDYVGLWYTAPNSVKYLYTLEGYDLEWQQSRGRRASYSNLAPGKYTFKVKASENESFHDEPIARFTFEIKKPFWNRWWFVVSMILLCLGAAYYILKIQEQQSQRDALIKKERAESQLQTIKAQINPHFLFNSFNTLINVIEEDPDLAVEYVEKLSDFYRTILQYRGKDLISLDEEIELVRNYFYLLQKRFGKNLIIELPTDGEDIFVPPLTVQMLVENAVKHNVISRSRPLTIEIVKEENDYLMIRNNLQRKRGQVQSTNFGLDSLVNRYQLLTNQSVLIEESEDYFTVRIPLLKSDML